MFDRTDIGTEFAAFEDDWSHGGSELEILILGKQRRNWHDDDWN